MLGVDCPNFGLPMCSSSFDLRNFDLLSGIGDSLGKPFSRPSGIGDGLSSLKAELRMPVEKRLGGEAPWPWIYSLMLSMLLNS